MFNQLTLDLTNFQTQEIIKFIYVDCNALNLIENIFYPTTYINFKYFQVRFRFILFTFQDSCFQFKFRLNIFTLFNCLYEFNFNFYYLKFHLELIAKLKA